VPRRHEPGPENAVQQRPAGRASAQQRNKSAPARATRTEHLPGAVLHHHVEGRVRFRIPSRRGDAPYFQRIAETLPGCAAVLSVAVNPTTAGVLVGYRGDLQTLVSYAKDHALFGVEHRPTQVPLGRRVSGAFGRLDKQLLSTTGGTLDLASVVFLALFGTGVVDLLRGNVARAMTLLAHAGVALLVGRSAGLAATEAKELAALLEGE
jgi:Heavy metal associated domain 2